MNCSPLEYELIQVSTTASSECRLIRAVNGAKDGLWEWNVKTDAVWYSRSFLEHLGYSEEEFPGVLASWSDRLHPEDYGPTFKAIERHLESGEPYDVQYRILAKRGTYHWFRARGNAYRDAAGEVNYMAGSIQSIDDLKQAESILEEQEAQLRQQQKLDALGSFASGIAHEFNNLLQAISGYTTFAMEAVEPASQTYSDLQQVISATKRAATITNKLLDYSRPSQAQSEECELGLIADEVASLVQPFFLKTIDFAIDLHDRNEKVYVDPNFFQQALLNLCLNARDAMGDQGNLLLRSELVSFSSVGAEARSNLQPGKYVCLLVTDTGCGIANTIQDLIFEPFFTTKDIGKGTGLGLSVTHSVIQQVGGHIEVYSRLQEGTTFRIYLPARADEQQGSTGESLPQGQGESILVVEGEALACDIGRRLLEKHGYRVSKANNGSEALKHLERNKAKPALVMISNSLPDMTGQQLFEEIQQQESGLPICFSTGFDPESLVSDALKKLQRPILSRPFDEDRLLRMVGDLLKKSRETQLDQ